MKSTEMYFGGVPTKPEVDALMALNIEEGKVVDYITIESVVKSSKGSLRWNGIIAAWKKRMLRERNLLLIAQRGEGYLVADQSTRVSHSSDLISQGRKRIVRAATICSTTDITKLDDEQKKICVHISMVPAKLRLAEITAYKAE